MLSMIKTGVTQLLLRPLAGLMISMLKVQTICERNKLSRNQIPDKRFFDTAHSLLDMVTVPGFSESPVGFSTH